MRTPGSLKGFVKLLRKMGPEMRVAIVHDWLYVIGGAEQVLREILQCYPNADVFTLFDLLKPEDREIVEDLVVTALADARRKAETAMQEKMQSLAGGLGLPPGMLGGLGS